MLRKAMRRMELISCGYILHAYGIRLIAKAYGKISQRILDTYVVLEFPRICRINFSEFKV